MTEDLLNRYKNKIATLTLQPSSGGVFEVTANGDLLFSKKETGRFPDHQEIIEPLEAKYIGE